MQWEVGIPGKESTIWADGVYKLIMTFPEGWLQLPHPDTASNLTQSFVNIRLPLQTSEMLAPSPGV